MSDVSRNDNTSMLIMVGFACGNREKSVTPCLTFIITSQTVKALRGLNLIITNLPPIEPFERLCPLDDLAFDVVSLGYPFGSYFRADVLILPFTFTYNTVRDVVSVRQKIARQCDGINN